MNLRVYTVRFDPGVLEAIALLEEDAMPCAVDNELLMRTPSGGLLAYQQAYLPGRALGFTDCMLSLVALKEAFLLSVISSIIRCFWLSW